MARVNRREFLVASAALTTMACNSDTKKTVTAPPPPPSSPPKTNDLPQGARIVFQGDSVTDAGRENSLSPNLAPSLGRGYPLFIAQYMLLTYPEQSLQLFNRARGGDTIPLMQARWQDDTIDFQPDLLSILIGLNDFFADEDNPNRATLYEQRYNALIDQTRQALPNTKLVIVEPYYIINPPVPDFDAFRAAAARVASRAGATFVPIHAILNQHVREQTHEYWFDYQHPTIAGSAAIAEQWLKTLEW